MKSLLIHFTNVIIVNNSEQETKRQVQHDPHRMRLQHARNYIPFNKRCEWDTK